MGLVDIVRMAEDRNGYRRFVFGAAYALLPGTETPIVLHAGGYCGDICIGDEQVVKKLTTVCQTCVLHRGRTTGQA